MGRVLLCSLCCGGCWLLASSSGHLDGRGEFVCGWFGVVFFRLSKLAYWLTCSRAQDLFFWTTTACRYYNNTSSQCLPYIQTKLDGKMKGAFKLY